MPPKVAPLDASTGEVFPLQQFSNFGTWHAESSHGSGVHPNCLECLQSTSTASPWVHDVYHDASTSYYDKKTERELVDDKISSIQPKYRWARHQSGLVKNLERMYRLIK